MSNPTCFFSYSHDSTEHKKWVRELAIKLQKNGVDTKLDQWDTFPGIDLTNYMETGIRESDFVLLICTPTFCDKANSGTGGVGYEKCIVTGEIFQGAFSPKKFVPILRWGNPEQSLPSYLKSKFFIDFRNNDELDLKLEELLRHIHKSPKHVKPSLGPKPSFRDSQHFIKHEPPHLISVKHKARKFDLETYKRIYAYAVDCLGGLCLSPSEAREYTFQKLRNNY